MITRITFAKAGAVALASVLALSSAAQAQPSGSYTSGARDGYGYDPCRREANGRGTAGTLIGGGIGAVIGSNAAARNARTEGALLGGLLGAIAGGVMGHKTAACNSSTYPRSSTTGPSSSADERYDRRDETARNDDWRRAPDVRDDRDEADDRDRAPEGRFEDRSRDDDCQLAESPVHMPDGTIQNRFVRVCRDASGRYAVVN
jgi:Glycine zipper 2TM domain